MINKLTGWFSAAIKDPKVKAKFKTLGFFPGGACGGAFDAYCVRIMTITVASSPRRI